MNRYASQQKYVADAEYLAAFWFGGRNGKEKISMSGVLYHRGYYCQG